MEIQTTLVIGTQEGVLINLGKGETENQSSCDLGANTERNNKKERDREREGAGFGRLSVRACCGAWLGLSPARSISANAVLAWHVHVTLLSDTCVLTKHIVDNDDDDDVDVDEAERNALSHAR